MFEIFVDSAANISGGACEGILRLKVLSFVNLVKW